MRAFVVLLAVVALMPACQNGMSMPWQKNANAPVESSNPLLAAPVVPDGLPLSTDSRFNDIPLPVGLTEVPERSFVFQSDTLEIGRMVYSTRADLNELVQFFIRESKNKGWSLVRVLEAEAKTIEFSMPGKKMVVSVQDRGMVKGRAVTITLTPDTNAISSL